MLTIKDLFTAFNSLSKAKGYVIAIVLTLGITLGALVAIFNLNYQLLAAPLPYPNADSLMVFKSEQYDNGQKALGRYAPYPALVETYQRKNDFFTRKALLKYTDSIERRMPGSPILNTISTTPEYFDIIKMPMALGRYFSLEEGMDSHIPISVISYKTWQKLFQGDANVLGKTINIMEVDFKIIGVAAKGYVEPSLFKTGWESDIWLPFDYDDMPLEHRNNWRTSINSGYVIGSLKSISDRIAAEHEETNYINQRFRDELNAISGFDNSTLDTKLLSMRNSIVGNTGNSTLLMMAGALGLLIIASANIINLMLARMANNQRTVAIQVALGAQHKHIFSHVLSEILWLVFGSCILAIFIARVLIDCLKKFGYEYFPRLHELTLDGFSFLFVVIVALVLSFLFSLLISRQLNHRQLISIMSSSGKGVVFQISIKIRRLLILSQVLIAGILLTVTLQVLIDSWFELTRSPGLEIEDQYQLQLSNAVLYATNTKEERRSYYDRILEELRVSSKVELASAVDSSPISLGNQIYRFIQQELGSQQRLAAVQTLSDGEFFNIAKMKLLKGRVYTNDDVRINANFMVVNETLARLLAPNGNVLGTRVYRQGESEASEVIGVVSDLQVYGAVTEPHYFWSKGSDWPDTLIKVKAGQVFDAMEINAICAKINPRIKVVSLKTTKQYLALREAPEKIAASVSAVLALLALSLAAIGIYGVLSYSVQLRRFELGIRMAIGARPKTIFLQVFRDNLMPVVIGLLFALIVLVGLWLWVQQTSYSLQTTSLGWLLPPVLIIALTAATSLLSVWQIIRKPASYVLRGD